MKRLLLASVLFVLPLFSQGQSRRLWLSGEISFTAVSPVDKTRRPFGSLVLGYTFEQELPCRLAVVTGIRTRSHNACIPERGIETRTSWDYFGIGYSRDYLLIPLQLRWQLPIVRWNREPAPKRGNMLYIAPHTGGNFNIGRGEFFFGESEVTEASVAMHRRPEDFFMTGEIGLALGLEVSGLFRLEPFVAYAFRGGRAIDFSLEAPYTAQTYSKYNTFQAGMRISICLVDWRRTAADRIADRRRSRDDGAASEAARISQRKNRKR